MSNDDRQRNKAQRNLRGESYELLWFSCASGRRLGARAAKTRAARLRRRLDHHMVEEGFAEYESEIQDELDAQFHQELTEAYMESEEAEEAQIRRECYVNILGFLRLPKDAEFFGDCNHPGVVYWTSQGRLEDAKESLRQEGGSPFGITRSSACSWVTHPDDDLMDGWPWSLREWTNFW